MNNVQIEESWKHVLSDEFAKPYFQSLSTTVREEYKSQRVFPKPQNVFTAFNLCPFDDVKVVIIGQDPYHGVGQAHGLSFSVQDGIALPPTLKNMYKEIEQDMGYKPYASGDLSRWAKQGVLMLNSVLTVRAGSPASHKGLGWEVFTDAVISTLAHHKKGIVYLLWGKFAQGKASYVDRSTNLVLTSGHPSPYSAHLFYGNHHFLKCNEYLVKEGKTPIDWH